MERDDPPGRTSSRAAPLAPQLLLVVLECGDSVFLSVRSQADGNLEFVASRFKSPKEHLVYPGFHLAVDPSSRYMALGCAQHHFVVYELESITTLNGQYGRNEPLRPVKSFRPRSVQGVIHKIEFLYPRPGDGHHIILLLIIVRNGKSRMVTYEWELGDDLRAVFAEEKNGHRMPVENQMPLLLIPLTVRSAFMAISPRQIAVCTEALHGPPNFERFDILEPPATINYHGREKPLWTAWARPSRLSHFFRTRDCIYLAREDGVVIFIEADSESTLTGSTFMDKFDCNISRAFSCLYDQFSDVLVMAGDSGPGAVWKVRSRTHVLSHLGCNALMPCRYRLDNRLSNLARCQIPAQWLISSQPMNTRHGTMCSARPATGWPQKVVGRQSPAGYLQPRAAATKALSPSIDMDCRRRLAWT